jgi:DNA repair exonuclease SbcCD ATPase subunit
MIKRVLFEKLEIKNFLSVGNDPVVVNFVPGVNVITGINKDQPDRRNGIGKSTITDAFSYALLGTTIRDLKKEFITNNVTNKTAEITLTFSVAAGNQVKRYELYRSIDPSKCVLYEDGIDITRDSMVNTTDYLSQILNITPEIFQNCIVMAINNTVPFMAKKKIEKRKFIESIFNLEIFSRMNSLLKDDYNETKRSFDIVNGKYDEQKAFIARIEEQKKNKLKEENDYKEKLLKRKEECEKQKEEYQNKINSIKEVDLKEVKQKIDDLKEKEKNVDIAISALVKKIGSLETKNEITFTNYSKIGTSQDACPVCLREININDKSHIHSKKKELKKEIDTNSETIKQEEKALADLEVKKQKIVTGIKTLEQLINKQKLAEQQKQHLKNNLKDVEKRLEQIETDLTSNKSSDNSLDNILIDTQNKLKDFESQLVKDRDLINTLDTVKFVISEEGVKSFIVKKILKLFNSKLGYYLRKLNSTAIITFNEYFEDTIVNEKGKLTCYDNYSGAEKKVIDLAIMFTFLEMLKLQGNVFYSVQFYDELLDTSLDETGVEMVLNILNEFTASNELGIYIISHRKECSKISSGDIVFLEKINGITKRVKAS